MKLSRDTAATVVNLNGKMLSGKSTKTNKAASDGTTEACVVHAMSFVCVGWCSHPVACLSLSIWGLSVVINQMTVLR